MGIKIVNRELTDKNNQDMISGYLFYIFLRPCASAVKIIYRGDAKAQRKRKNLENRKSSIVNR
jgi:hypothetical protein